MAGGGPQSQEDTEELGVVSAGAEKGGGVLTYIGTFICCGGTGGTSVWVGDVGYAPVYWEDSGQFPPQGGTQVDGM